MNTNPTLEPTSTPRHAAAQPLDCGSPAAAFRRQPCCRRRLRAFFRSLAAASAEPWAVKSISRAARQQGWLRKAAAGLRAVHGAARAAALPAPSLITFVILHSSFGVLHAAPPPELTVLRTQYEKVVAEKVTAPFETALGELNTKFSSALDSAVNAAKQAGKLDDVLAIQGDKKRLAGSLPIPDDEDGTPDALKKLRSIYRDQLAKLEQQRNANHATILPGYTKKLQDLEATLTKADRIEEATEIKAYRAGLSADSPPPGPAAAKPTNGVAASPASTAPLKNIAPPDERKVVLEALRMGAASIDVKADGKSVHISKLEDIPEGTFEIHYLKLILGKEGEKKYRGFDFIAGLPGLTSLALDNFPTEDKDMSAIGALPSLVILALPYPHGHFTGSRLGQLAAPEKLRQLNLSGSPIGSKGAAAIGRFTNLEQLALSGSAIKDNDLKHLAGLTSLTMLKIQKTDTTIEGLRYLKALTKLTEFGWTPVPKKGRANFAEVAAQFPLVTKFTLAAEKGNVTEDFAGLAAFPALAEVYLEGPASGTAVLGGLAAVPTLKKLSGYMWQQVTDEDVALLQSSSSLSIFTVDNAPQLTNKSLQSLAKIPTLNRVFLNRVSKVTQAGVDEFTKTRPDVSIDYRK